MFLPRVRTVLNSRRTRAIYEALWVPGLNHDIDRDDGLRVSLRWLAEAEGKYGGSGLIVMYPKSMMDAAPLLRRAASRWEIVSRRTRRTAGRGPVLCVWPPDDRVLELAEQRAARKALCVISGALYDISAWIDKSQAHRLGGSRCCSGCRGSGVCFPAGTVRQSFPKSLGLDIGCLARGRGSLAPNR